LFENIPGSAYQYIYIDRKGTEYYEPWCITSMNWKEVLQILIRPWLLKRM